MHSTLILNATLVNEGVSQQADLLIKGQRIEKIDRDLQHLNADLVVDAKGLHLLPGMIDDQVHFREPGLTEKGSIATESAAAVAGGITSYMEMPNVNPATVNAQALSDKRAIASRDSWANYAFYLGASHTNLDDIKSINIREVCGVKVFMGASTGNLLVENPQVLDSIFRESPILIATHCESGPVIEDNIRRLKQHQPEEFTIDYHPQIRDTKACYESSSYAVSLAKKYQSQLHVLHITTEKELSLFSAPPLHQKNITAEVCVHHLRYCDEDYARLGNQIKCNPAIKTKQDRQALRQALNSNHIDIIATDHAPHLWSEKNLPYPQAPAGLPLVQYALTSVLDLVHDDIITLEKAVEKMAHAPALRYAVADRGFIREGYYADLVLVDLQQKNRVNQQDLLYKCGWSPQIGETFSSTLISTFINGYRVYHQGKLQPKIHALNPALPLIFNR